MVKSPPDELELASRQHERMLVNIAVDARRRRRATVARMRENSGEKRRPDPESST
jgi:hypothetical protein